jgi:hypothetical protein
VYFEFDNGRRQIREADAAHAGPSLHHLWQIHFKWRKQTITFIQSAPTGVVRGDYQRLTLAAWRALAHSSGIS